MTVASGIELAAHISEVAALAPAALPGFHSLPYHNTSTHQGHKNNNQNPISNNRGGHTTRNGRDGSSHTQSNNRNAGAQSFPKRQNNDKQNTFNKNKPRHNRAPVARTHMGGEVGLLEASKDAPLKASFNGDFDFSVDAIASAKNTETVSVEPKYVAGNSFFDSISCEALNGKNVSAANDREKLKQTDCETFGPQAQTHKTFSARRRRRNDWEDIQHLNKPNSQQRHGQHPHQSSHNRNNRGQGNFNQQQQHHQSTYRKHNQKTGNNVSTDPIPNHHNAEGGFNSGPMKF